MAQAYDVVIDFGDNAVHDTPKRCNTDEELKVYLNMVPSTFGFWANGKATVHIQKVDTENDHPKLPFTHA